MSSIPTISSVSSYAILGCGSVGHAVADELVERGCDVLILDKDEGRVEALRDQDLDAQVHDIRESSVAAEVADREVVLVLSSDMEANRKAVNHIRDAGGDQFIVGRAKDPVSTEELADAGTDAVINPTQVIADAALRELDSGELKYNAEQLSAVLGRGETLAIITHNNPDPDSIASGVALQAIAAELGVDADIIYHGEMGRQENRAFVNLLEIELHSIEEVDLEDYDTLALVDQAKAEDTDLDFEVDIYIDHFGDGEEVDAEFVDVRPNLSATSTILTKYIQEFDITPASVVATALLYGIRQETVDFRRDTTPGDLMAAAYLYPFADHDILEQVESPNMSPETLDVLADAITNRQVQGSHLVSNAGYITDRDALTQAAGRLLNLEGITTTAVFGIIEADERIYLAARSKDIRMSIGNVLADAFGDMGEVSGHSTQADVEIPLGIFTGIDSSDENRETLVSLVEEAVRRKLFEAMGVESENGS